MAIKLPWAGTVRLEPADADTLFWLSRKLGPARPADTPKWRTTMPFVDVIRLALRNERARIEGEVKGK